MRKRKVIFLAGILLVGAILVSAFFWSRPKRAGIKVTSTPASGVYVNGVYVGKTTFSASFPPGQISLKLVPLDQNTNLTPFEAKVNLVAGIQTYVDREFAGSEENSSSTILSFEKTGGRLAGVTVISTPDKAEVWIDGTSQGTTPYNFNSITTGPHTIAIKSAGFKEKNLNIKTVEGLRLTLYAKLARLEANLPTPAPSFSLPAGPKQHVLIGSTSTNFLRMRTSPGESGDEIAELRTGQKYVYLETDEITGWYKILYEEPSPGLPNGITGWVSNQYSKIVPEDGSSASPSP